MSIIIKSLTYIHSDKQPLFSDINFSVSKGQKAALVGDNGSGKSTLIKIISGLQRQSSGEIVSSGQIYYVPQHTGQYDNCTLAEALAINAKIKALHNILNGNASTENFTILNDDWDVEERFKTALSSWGIDYLEHSQSMGSLSGGEKTKVFLAGIQIHSPQIILLDEPSNHLDMAGRAMLYDFVAASRSTILCVSHDRTLLNLFDTTLELSHDKIAHFGGNYDFYKQEKENEMQALQKTLSEKEKTFKQTLQKSRKIAEQRQRLESRGKSATEKKSLPRIVANNLGKRAEQSSAKIKEAQDEKLHDMLQSMKEAQEQIRQQTVLRIDFRTSSLHKGKVLAEVKEINFSYGEKALWERPLTFVIRSGERIALEGSNGSGKTTLVKILTGKLKLSHGEVFIADFDYLYIDQDYSAINNSLSLFEQVQLFNDRHLEEHFLKTMLHTYQFPKETWDKKCDCLSGGEKMKLILCCASIRNNTPDMIILDEPTNNLDIYSQKILTETMKSYNGTVLLISHDAYLKREIGIENAIVVD